MHTCTYMLHVCDSHSCLCIVLIMVCTCVCDMIQPKYLRLIFLKQLLFNWFVIKVGCRFDCVEQELEKYTSSTRKFYSFYMQSLGGQHSKDRMMALLHKVTQRSRLLYCSFAFQSFALIYTIQDGQQSSSQSVQAMAKQRVLSF